MFFRSRLSQLSEMFRYFLCNHFKKETVSKGPFQISPSPSADSLWGWCLCGTEAGTPPGALESLSDSSLHLEALSSLFVLFIF